jgi:O-antigen/teichoic acid export membrane protein
MTVREQSNLGLIVKNAGMDVFGQAFNIVFSFAASVIITRTIGPELFGKYSLANSAIQILGILAVFGLNYGVVRLTSKYMSANDHGRVKGTVTSAVGLTSIFSLGLLALTAIAAPALTRKFYPHVEGFDLVLRVYLIGLPFFALMTALNGYTQGLKTLKPSVIVEMIVRPVSRLALVLLLFLAGWRLFAVVIGSVGSLLVAAVLAFILAVRLSPFDFRRAPGVGVGQELFFYSLPLVLANFMNVLISRSNVMISGYYLDSGTVGILSATLVLAPFVSMSLVSFSRIFAPLISELWERGDVLELMNHFKIVSKWIFTLSLPVFCVYVLFAPGLLKIFGDDFPNGAVALKILALGQIVNAVVGPVGFILTMTGRQKLNLVNSIVLAGSSIGLNILLIPRYGMNGAALATTLALSAVNIVRVVQVKALYGFTPFRYDLAKPIAAGAVASAGFYIANRFLRWTDIPHTILLCVGFAAVYLVLLYVLGLREEREVLSEVLKRKKQ